MSADRPKDLWCYNFNFFHVSRTFETVLLLKTICYVDLDPQWLLRPPRIYWNGTTRPQALHSSGPVNTIASLPRKTALLHYLTTVIAVGQMSGELKSVTWHAATHITLERVLETVSAGMDRIHHHTAEVDVTRLAVVPRTTAATQRWYNITGGR